MRKFILVDQSIQNAGGHHLEYAIRVLKAAKKQGFKTVLATSKRCEAIKSDFIDEVERAFTYTFWQNHQSEYEKLTGAQKSFLRKIKWWLSERLYELMCSPLGFAYIVAAQGVRLKEMFNCYGSPISGKRLSFGAIIVGYVLVRIKRTGDRILRQFRRLPLLHGKTRRISIYVLGSMLLPLLSVVIIPYLLTQKKSAFNRSQKNISQFSNDLRNLLVSCEAENGDLVFIPNVGNVELLGSGACIGTTPIPGLTWHFLFRRNIFFGREPAYTGQIKAQIATLQAFEDFKQRVNAKEVNFYTDTEALTAQYNRLSVFNFKTLPIPLDESLARSQSVRTKLNIAYIGDARDEKGFPLIATLIDDLKAAGYSADNLRFILQSNFNVPGGEPGSRIALAEISTQSSELVNLIVGPFESDRYTALINSADLILIPYDSENYYARSSGIFAEAMAAGVPVVATAKSWMATELLDLSQKYYQTLFDSSRPIQSVHIDCDQDVFELEIRPGTQGEHTWLLIKVSQLFERHGEYLDVTWTSTPYFVGKANKKANYFRAFSIDLRNSSGFALMRLPAREKLLLKFTTDHGNKVGNLSAINTAISRISVYELNLPPDTPIYQVGSLFLGEEDLSSAAIEVIEKHSAYLEHARSFRDRWTEFHNSDRLLSILALEAE